MYQKQYKDCQKKLNEISSRCRQISFLRLIFCVTAGIFLYFGYLQNNTVCCLLSAAAVLVFLLLVQYHRKLRDQQDYVTNYQSVIRDYTARLGDGWQQFSIHGAQYLRDDHPQTADLDIFGKNSLYQYICTASTVFGQDRLALWLDQSEPENIRDVQNVRNRQKAVQNVRNRQKAVQELAEKTDFTLHFEASARKLRTAGYDASKKNMEDFFHTLEQETRFPFPCRIAIRVFPILTLAFLFVFSAPSLFPSFVPAGISQQLVLSCFLVCAMLQLLASFLGHAQSSRLLAPVYKMNQAITPYRILMEQLAQEPFESPYLKQLQQALGCSGQNTSAAAEKAADARTLHSQKNTEPAAAIKALKELEAIADAAVIRHNVYASLILNSLFCYDFHCVERYCRWKAACRHTLRPWLEAVGSVEALISLGVIGRTKKIHTLPLITDTAIPTFSAKGLQHPFIKEPDAVGNDFYPTHHTCIITGSNMSGKTTFMRSIGTNLLLAYAGGYCTASELSVSPMKVCTSMRTEDNVNAGISSFYAELLRIKKITETSRQQLPMISLIDEIYKGTNSKDRIYAARETVKNLSRPYAFTILTTHDLELCSLENDTDIDAENYHFSEYYSQNQILFDYKMKKGRCTTSNARYLLQMAGIL